MQVSGKGTEERQFSHKGLTLKSSLRRLNTYFKFMVVRNPLERLVSGYRNMIEPPLNPDSKGNHAVCFSHSKGDFTEVPSLRIGQMVAVKHVISIDSSFYGLCSVPRDQRQQR